MPFFLHLLMFLARDDRCLNSPKVNKIYNDHSLHHCNRFLIGNPQRRKVFLFH